MSYVSQKKIKPSTCHNTFLNEFYWQAYISGTSNECKNTKEEYTKSTLKLSFNLLEIDILAFIGYLRM